MNIRSLWCLRKELLSLLEVTIRISGDQSSLNIFHTLTKPHPKYRLIQNKRWGVALLPLPDTFELYLRGRHMQNVRTGRSNARKQGFRFSSINPYEHLQEILSVNASLQNRQGRPIRPDYLSIERLKHFFDGKPAIFGILNGDGILRAYADTPVCGEVFLFSRLLGHGEDLDKGIMYLLLTEVIRQMIDRKRTHGTPLWAMYDIFFGGSDGLRTFKSNLGFKPYNVKWLWKPC